MSALTSETAPRQNAFLVLCLGLLVLLTLVFHVCPDAGQASQEQNNDSLLVRRLKAQAYRAYYGVGEPVNFERALSFYERAAHKGDPEAMYIYGGMLYQGQGTEENKRGGFKWLMQAAEAGKTTPESLAVIGSMYLRGQTVPQNFLEAKRWLKKGAQQGNMTAQTDLAYMFYNGLGGERDYEKALALYEKAAFQGDILAQANTGLMYATGTGTDIDRAKGYAWYSLAASRGNTMAAINRNELMTEMSWEELNGAQAISLDLYRRVENIKEPRLLGPEQR
ncbi:sel1 repeat family protein [Desulfobulbus rhabdoformis]|uniref:tetratricopeptide repeat protein n=1 Tax=Desulfobulbus rhabdoformis TaxID=34032 RepID=UPI001964EFE6|nr:tetratricopeptide repeat protein [Desulfobulbus rhabdoformis]MBM9613866.1 sel1 repeat family protein [Desulfobulbus rhabdoformis]